MQKRRTFGTTMKHVGSLLIMQGMILVLPMIISLIYAEWFSSVGFFIAALVEFGLGIFLYMYFKTAEDVNFKNALIIAAFSWLSITLMGGLPFLIIAHLTPAEIMNNFIPPGSGYDFSSLVYFKKPLHCFFESMSAYTTTGLTMAVHEPSIGKGILFYRSLAQWLGGAGFIILALAVLNPPSKKSHLLLYRSDSSNEKLRPQIIQTARTIWKVYLIITAFAAVYLFIGTRIILPDYSIGENIFDSINHAMTGQSTGGFSTLDDSISGYHSKSMEMLYLLPMILGSFSIPFFFKIVYKMQISEIWKDIQTRALIIAFILGSILLSLLLAKAEVVPNPWREGIFQFVSAMSTTGWQTSNIAGWDWRSILFICFAAMFVGGATGATVGGIKMMRALMIGRGLQWQVKKVFLSINTVKTLKFNGKVMLAEEANEEFAKDAAIAIMFFLFIIGSAVIATAYIGGAYDFSDSLFEAASAQSTVGLSTGITDPSMSPVLESIYIFQMWAGRLEVIPVLALIRSIFWGTRYHNI